GAGEGHRPEFHGRGSEDTRLLGDSSFIERVVSEVEELSLPGRMNPESLSELVASYYQLPDLLGRSHRHAEARAACAWVARETGVCTLTEMARFFQRDISSISSGARRIGARQGSAQVLSDMLEVVRKYSNSKA
ncbi:MAG TPA: hypothetical protein PLZ16_04145, partial [Gammaproteobacteria bacterium]|nr:hypothetical protein [Gammaproteobacteria bacterium]